MAVNPDEQLHNCVIIDDRCTCETCDTDDDEYGNVSCKTCKWGKWYN